MGKKVGRSRTAYEGKLCKLLMAEKEEWYALTSGNNQGWDVHLYMPIKGPWQRMVVFEVKTSVKQKKTFSGTQFEQLQRYRDIWKMRHIPTFYAYRWVTSIKKYQGKTFNEHDKWRFFHISDVPKTVHWNKGATWKEFIRWLK